MPSIPQVDPDDRVDLVRELRIADYFTAELIERAAVEIERLRTALSEGPRWIPVAERVPTENVLVVIRGNPHPPYEFQTIQVAFIECGHWYAWHYGSFAPRLIDPVEWAGINAPIDPVHVDAQGFRTKPEAA